MKTFRVIHIGGPLEGCESTLYCGGSEPVPDVFVDYGGEYRLIGQTPVMVTYQWHERQREALPELLTAAGDVATEA